MIEKIALRLLSIKSRSTDELRKKLNLRGFCSEEIEPVLIKMADLGYLNDSETTERRFKNFVAKGYGPRLVALKMKEQGLTMPSYPIHLQKEVALQLLKTVAFKRKDSQKKGQTLQRRGFDLEVIFSILGQEC
jgi:SOS response regulatory protein OraA/RecX